MVPALYPPAPEKRAKTGQTGLFKNFGGERKSLVFQVLQIEAKRLTIILNLARLPIPPRRLAKPEEN
jgi:hypothetical protein